jgi:hypothetical protein
MNGVNSPTGTKAASGHNTGAPSGNDAWQRHVMTGLWIFLVVLFLVSSLLLYAKAHGFLAGHDAPVSSWPASWP